VAILTVVARNGCATALPVVLVCSHPQNISLRFVRLSILTGATPVRTVLRDRFCQYTIPRALAAAFDCPRRMQ
jgi:hypothetical protein